MEPSLRHVLGALVLDWLERSQQRKGAARWKRCACGVERTKEDPRTTRVDGTDYEARLFGNHGPLYDLVCRSCRSCGAVYALARLQDESLSP